MSETVRSLKKQRAYLVNKIKEMEEWRENDNVFLEGRIKKLKSEKEELQSDYNRNVEEQKYTEWQHYETESKLKKQLKSHQSVYP